VSPNGRQVAVAMYFSGDVLLHDAATMRVQHRLAIGPQPAADEVRRGEMIFHDASYRLQRWLSCSTARRPASTIGTGRQS